MIELAHLGLGILERGLVFTGVVSGCVSLLTPY